MLSRESEPLWREGGVYYALMSLCYLLWLVVPALCCPGLLAVFGSLVFGTILLFALRAYVQAIASTAARRRIAPPCKGPLPFVSLIIPAFNEAPVLDRTIQSVLALDYPKDRIEFLYVYEAASADATEDIILQYAQMDARIRALKHPAPPGGKAAISNFGITQARGAIVGIFDADHSLNPDLVRRSAAYFSKPSVGCVRGRCRIINRTANLLARVISLERDIVERLGIFGAYCLKGFPNFGGGHGFFRREVFESIGRFDEEVLTEDIKFSVDLNLGGYDIVVDPDLVSWEEGPTTLASFVHQRKRWARGWMQVWRHRFWRIALATGLPLSRKADMLLSLTSAVCPVLTVSVVPILVLAFLGYRTSSFPAVWAFGAWMFATLTPMLMGLWVWVLDQKRERPPRPSDILYLPLLLPHLIFLFFVSWVCFLDEFVLDKEYAYIKTVRCSPAGGTDSATKRRELTPLLR